MGRRPGLGKETSTSSGFPERHSSVIAPAGHHCNVRSGHLNATFGGKDMGSMAQTGLLLVPSDALGHTWALPGVLGAGQGLPPESGPGNLNTVRGINDRSEYVHTLSGGQLIRDTLAKKGLATGFCGGKPSAGAKTYQNVLSATKYAVGRNGLLARMGCRQASGGACREVACRAGARAPLPARAVHGRRRGASSRHGTGCYERQRS